MTTTVVVLLIVLAILLVLLIAGFVVSLSVLLFNQSLLVNEVNKRLLALTSETIISYKISQEEVDNLMNSIDQKPALQKDSDEINKPFDPFAASSDL